MLDSLLGALTASIVSNAAKTVAIAAAEGIGTFSEKIVLAKENERKMKETDLQMKRMDMIMRQNPNDYIQMRVNTIDFINQDFRDIIQNLAGMGFYDINIREVLVKKGLFEKERFGQVLGVSINGARQFDTLSLFPKDSHVIVDAIIHKKEDHLFMPELINIRKGSVLFQRPIKRCEYCGVAVSPGQNYCIGCGAPL